MKGTKQVVGYPNMEAYIGYNYLRDNDIIKPENPEIFL